MHYFNFESGKELSRMAATWFVSYAYYQYIDTNHLSWMDSKTVETRKHIYKRTQIYHKLWLKKYYLWMKQN